MSNRVERTRGMEEKAASAAKRNVEKRAASLDLGRIVSKAKAHVDDPRQRLSPITRMWQSRLWNSFVGWLEAAGVVKGSMSAQDVTVENINIYSDIRAAEGVGRNDTKITYGTLIKEVRVIMAEAHIRFPETKNTLQGDEADKPRRYVVSLAQNEFISKKKREKINFGHREIRKAVSASIMNIKDRCPAFTLQIACLTLFILHTGVRISSILSPMRDTVQDWPYIQWKDVTFFKTDSKEIILNVHISHRKNAPIDWPGMKKTIITDQTDATFLDTPLLWLALGRVQDVFQQDPVEWMATGASGMALGIKEEALRTPVFRSQNRDHTMTVDKALTSDSAVRSVKLLFLNGGLSIKGTLYSLRRNFAENATKSLSREQATMELGHRIDTSTMFNDYVGDQNDVDYRALIRGQRSTNTALKTILTPYFHRTLDPSIYKLTKKETEEALKEEPQIEEWRKELGTLKQKMTVIPKEQVEELMGQYEAVCRKYETSRKRVLARAKREKILHIQEAEHKQAPHAQDVNAESEDAQIEELLEVLQTQNPATQNNDEDDIARDGESDDDDDDGAAENETFNTWKGRQDKLRMMSSRCSWEAGPIYCDLCNNEEDMPDSEPHEGIVMFIRHLITARHSHLSPGSYGAGTPGRHSAYSVYMRDMIAYDEVDEVYECLAPQCGYSKPKAAAVRSHVKKEHWEDFPGEPSTEELYREIQQYFWDHFMFPIKTSEIQEIHGNLKAAGEKRRAKDQAKSRAKKHQSSSK